MLGSPCKAQHPMRDSFGLHSLEDVLSWLGSTPLTQDPAVIGQARRIVLDTVGCAYAGSRADSLVSLQDACARVDPGRVRLGNGPGLSVGAAAQLFAYAACWDEACEGHAGAHGRPGVATLSAVHALAGSLSYREVLDAFIQGYEVSARMARALRIKPGMHVDGNWPAFGCAVAASRALGLTDKQAASAVSFAACQVPMSLYLPVRQGSTARNAYLGHAAVLGIQGALAAQAGIDAPTLESVSEYARVGLGQEVGPWVGPGRFEILDAYLKPFAAVRHVHYGAAAALALRERIGTARIEQIRLSVYEEATVYCANRAPATAIQAQFSLTFGLAAALRFGGIDHETYRPAQFSDPELGRLESLVEVAVDPDLTARQARGATLRVLVNGQWLEATVGTILGDAALPLTDAQVIEKFVTYAQGTVGVESARRIAEGLLYGDLDVPYTGLLA